MSENETLPDAYALTQEIRNRGGSAGTMVEFPFEAVHAEFGKLLTSEAEAQSRIRTLEAALSEIREAAAVNMMGEADGLAFIAMYGGTDMAARIRVLESELGEERRRREWLERFFADWWDQYEHVKGGDIEALNARCASGVLVMHGSIASYPLAPSPVEPPGSAGEKDTGPVENLTRPEVVALARAFEARLAKHFAPGREDERELLSSVFYALHWAATGHTVPEDALAIVGKLLEQRKPNVERHDQKAEATEATGGDRGDAEHALHSPAAEGDNRGARSGAPSVATSGSALVTSPPRDDDGPRRMYEHSIEAAKRAGVSEWILAACPEWATIGEPLKKAWAENYHFAHAEGRQAERLSLLAAIDDDNGAEVLWMHCTKGLESQPPRVREYIVIGRAFKSGIAQGRQAERVERGERARYLLPFAEQLLTWVRIQPPSDVQLRAVAQATILVADLKELQP